MNKHNLTKLHSLCHLLFHQQLYTNVSLPFAKTNGSNGAKDIGRKKKQKLKEKKYPKLKEPTTQKTKRMRDVQ